MEIEQRVKTLEDCYREMKKEVADGFSNLKDWLGNGYSEHIARVVAVELAEYQRQEWEREREDRRLQLEAQKEANRQYGEQKDAERKDEQSRADRRNRLLIALIAVLGPSLTALVTWLLTK